MPKRGNEPFQRTGRDIWYVWHNGKQVPLGKDREEAERRWHELKSRPVRRPVPKPKPVPEPLSRPESCTTLAELVTAYTEFVEGDDEIYMRNGEKTSWVGVIRNALHRLTSAYPRMLIENLGPKPVKRLQRYLLATGCSRKYVNDMTTVWKMMLTWGIEEELFEASKRNYSFLTKRVCRLKVKKRRGVKCVPQDRLTAVLAHLLNPQVPGCVAKPAIWGMLEFQRLTGARPGEVRILRNADIDKSGDVWEYRPPTHKTEDHDVERIIVIGPKAQELLAQFHRDSPDAYIFSPDADGRRPFRRDVYRNVVVRACEQCFGLRDHLKQFRIPRKATALHRADLLRQRKLAAYEWRKANCFTPNQLRHNFATKVREVAGIEASQVALGHTNVNTTEIYAERNLNLIRSVIGTHG